MADAGQITESVGVTLIAKGMPESCQPLFQKIGIGTVYLSDSQHREPTSKMDVIGGSAVVHYGGNKGGKRYESAKQQGADKHDDYKCGDSVWLELDSRLKSLHSHHVLAEKTRWRRVPVLNADGSSYDSTHCK